MIQLRRNRRKVPAAFLGAKREALALRLLKEAQAQAFAFDPAIWKKAKTQLKAETHGKCAYCEADTAVVAHGDVEHFRPKSVYWWLAYCYDNYLFSCQLCNQSFKRDHFPVGGSRMRGPRVTATTTAARLARLATTLSPDPALDDPKFVRRLKRERAGLLFPYAEDPEPLFAWKADDTLREVELTPKRSKRSREAVAAAQQFLGLNRADLKRIRHRQYLTVETLAQMARHPDVPATLRDRAADQLKRLLADDAEFAGMARYFVRVKWRVPL